MSLLPANEDPHEWNNGIPISVWNQDGLPAPNFNLQTDDTQEHVAEETAAHFLLLGLSFEMQKSSAEEAPLDISQ